MFTKSAIPTIEVANQYTSYILKHSLPIDEMVAADYTSISRTNTMLSETGKEASEEVVKTAFAKDVNGH